jgi:hypothetical protein
VTHRDRGHDHVSRDGSRSGTGWDSTVLNYLDFFVGIQTSNAGNGIQIYQYTVELLSERN